MSNVSGGIGFVVPDDGERLVVAAELQASLVDQWPMLSLVLCGTKGGEGVKAVPPCSIILKCRDGKLGFCISPATGSQVAFGVLGDPSKGFDALEHELVSKRFSWVPRRNYRG